MEKYSREEIVSHLYTMRALECGVYRLEQELNECDGFIRNAGVPEQIREPQEVEEGSVWGALIASAIFGLLLPFGGWIIDDLISIVKKSSAFTGIGWFAYFIVLVFVGFSAFNGKNRAKEQNEMERQRYYRAVDSDRKRVKEELQQKQEVIRYKRGIKGEWERLASLRDRLYDEYRIVTKDFRNIWGVFALYDYMESSQGSLQDAENHYDHRIIQEQLGTIIEQNNTIILNQYIQQAKQDETNNLLRSQGRKLDRIKQGIDDNNNQMKMLRATEEANHAILQAQYLRDLIR